MTKYLRDRIIWMFFFVALVAILTPINLSTQIGRAFEGINAGPNIQKQYWTIHAATPEWWPGIALGNLRPGDILLEIEGEKYGSNVSQILENAEKVGKLEVTLKIKRERTIDGQKPIQDLKITIQHLSIADVLDIALPNFINSVCFWIVALGVYALQPQDRLNRIFAITCCVIAATQSLAKSSILPVFNNYAWFASFIWAFISPFTGATLLHFARVFPVERPTSKTFLILLYGCAGTVGLVFASTRFFFIKDGFSKFSSFLDQWCFGISMAILFVGWALLILSCITAGVTSWKKSRRVTPKITIVLASILICAIYIIPLVVDALKITNLTLFPLGLDARYLLTSVPIGFAFISLRYKSFRSAQPPAWLSISLIIALNALFASICAWIWWRTSQIMERPPFWQILLVCLSLSLFWKYSTVFSNYLVRILNWQSISSSSVEHFSQLLMGNTNLVSLPKAMTDFLTEKLKLEQAAIWLWDDETSQFELVSTWPPTSLSLLPHHLPLPIDANLQYSQPLRIGSEKNSVSVWLQTQVNIKDWDIALPLGIDHPVGLILIGQRLDEEIFDERDLNTLELIGRQATLFLFSAQVTYWLDKAQENERFRIAQDLHDTIQQSLNAVSYHLHIIQKTANHNIEQARLFSLECQNEIKDAIRNLYEIRRSLDPNELAYGLVEPLRLLIERATRIRGLNTHFTILTEIDERLSPLSRRALFRMVKQALDNTLAHAEARNFDVELEIEDNRMCFRIEDDGKGSTSEQRAFALSSGHMGLKTMRTRIESLGGEFIYQSQLGSGTKIIGWIPISLS